MAVELDDWYENHHRCNETDAFVKWWHEAYGPPERYDDDPHEYWVRRAFALMGWVAAKGVKEPWL